MGNYRPPSPKRTAAIKVKQEKKKELADTSKVAVLAMLAKNDLPKPKEIVFYCDGSCVSFILIGRIIFDYRKRKNGQVGSRAGYGVYFGDDHKLNISRKLLGERQTNQRAELTVYHIS